MKTNFEKPKELEIREVSDIKLDKKQGSEEEMDDKKASIPTQAF